MTHKINVADFAAFCRGRGDEGYTYSNPFGCALALFLRQDHPDANVGSRHYALSMDFGAEEIEIPLGVKRAVQGRPFKFSAVADRLGALVEQPA